MLIIVSLVDYLSSCNADKSRNVCISNRDHNDVNVCIECELLMHICMSSNMKKVHGIRKLKSHTLIVYGSLTFQSSEFIHACIVERLLVLPALCPGLFLSPHTAYIIACSSKPSQ